MRLWSDEIEQMRGEARQAVAAGFAARMAMLTPSGPPPADPLARVQHRRAMLERLIVPVPGTIERDVAGVPCRIVLPDGPTAAVYLHFHGGGMIAGLDGANLVFGIYDWGRSPSQRGVRPHEGPDLLDPEGIRFYCDSYLPGRTDDERRHPTISPAFADLHGLPPALMSVGTCDHLLDDTLVLAARSVAAGNDVELFVAPDMPHGFTGYPCGIAARWTSVTDAWFGDVLARPPRTRRPAG
jgi:acetyl esterase/lipase